MFKVFHWFIILFYILEKIFFLEQAAELSDAANEKATELENAAQGKSRYFAAKIFVFIDD
jgi:hypothetical protein